MGIRSISVSRCLACGPVGVLQNLSFVSRDGRTVAGDVHGVITLDESLGKVSRLPLPHRLPALSCLHLTRSASCCLFCCRVQEPECIWSVRFAKEAEFGPPPVGMAKSSKPLSPSPIPTATSAKKPSPVLDHPYPSSSEDSPPTSSGESPPPRVTHGSSKVRSQDEHG